jgi:hypothetical protein
MHHAEGQSFFCRAIDELQQTTGIRRCHRGRAGGLDVRDFAGEKLSRHFGLGEIVNARAAAAPGASGSSTSFKPGIALSNRRGWVTTFCPCARWQDS